MMIRKLVAPLALCVVAACDGNPLGAGGGGGEPPVVDNDVPAAVALDLDAAGYNPGDATITVRLRSQDGTQLDQSYVRNAAFDIPGYVAYTTQATTSNRFAVALTAESGDVKAIQVVDGGQFSSYFAGGSFTRSGTFTNPGPLVGAQADYSGTYVGLLNTGIPAPGGPGGTLNPTISDRVTGRALLTADFTDMSVSGGVDTRTNVRTGQIYVDIALVPTTISTTGTFVGIVERLDGQWVTAGDYAGIFGTQGENVAAILVFRPTTSATLVEHGIIVLPSCATGGGPACP